MSSPRVWFITGTSTGLGKALTELVLAKGEIVVAATRRTEPLADLQAKHPASRLLVLKLDVNDAAAIPSAFAQVKAAFGRLDVVVNNAGWATFGEVESVREADARAIFDTNFWGAVHVSRAALAFFRDVNAPGVGGRLIQISSVVGFVGLPGQAFYSASKFALEGLTEGIAAEIDPAWNIKVSLIQLGSFVTEGVRKITWSPEHPAYNKPGLPAHELRGMWDSFKGDQDAKGAVEVFYTIAGLQDPPLHIPVGKDAVRMAKAKLEQGLAEVEKTAYLSENLKKAQV